jgi:transcriptional regulator with XRE-family HTH domain
MIISERLKAIRTAKNLSQGEIEARTGLLRCYISRVENGHTVPSVETLEKIARGLDVPMYQLFYEGDGSPKIHAAITHIQSMEKNLTGLPAEKACAYSPIFGKRLVG